MPSPPMKDPAMMQVEAKWSWWAGRSEDWMDLGNYSSREEAVAGGMRSIGEGEGDFAILEATALIPPPLDAEDVLNNYFEWLGDCSDYYSGEGDGPEWLLGKDQQKIAEAELQDLLTAWSAKWLVPHMTSPDIFGSTRNAETIANKAERAPVDAVANPEATHG